MTDINGVIAFTTCIIPFVFVDNSFTSRIGLESTWVIGVGTLALDFKENLPKLKVCANRLQKVKKRTSLFRLVFHTAFIVLDQTVHCNELCQLV